MNNNKCSSVEITEDRISEFDRNKRVVSILRKDISEIVLKYGFVGERFLIQIICGLILILLSILFGFLPIYHMFKADDSFSGVPAATMIAFAVPMAVIGILLITGLFKRRYYLLVQSNNNQCKIIFQNKIELQEVSHFIDTVNSNLKYEITRDNELKL